MIRTFLVGSSAPNACDWHIASQELYYSMLAMCHVFCVNYNLVRRYESMLNAFASSVREKIIEFSLMHGGWRYVKNFDAFAHLLTML